MFSLGIPLLRNEMFVQNQKRFFTRTSSTRTRTMFYEVLIGMAISGSGKKDLFLQAKLPSLKKTFVSLDKISPNSKTSFIIELFP